MFGRARVLRVKWRGEGCCKLGGRKGRRRSILRIGSRGGIIVESKWELGSL